MYLNFEKLVADAVVPKAAHGYTEDAGADLSSIEDYILHPGETKAIRTGIAIELPVYYEGQVRSRSGLAAKHSVFVLNSPGTIDPGFRGEIKVLLHNAGREFFTINKGDRIAQFVVAQYEPVYWTESVLNHSERGTNGLGSTGVSH